MIDYAENFSVNYTLNNNNNTNGKKETDEERSQRIRDTIYKPPPRGESAHDLQMLITGGRKGGRPKSRVHHAPTLASIDERKSAATSRASNYSTASTASAATAPWNSIRLGLSQKSCRFELPMDLLLLKTMSPLEYVKQYSIVSTRRSTLYKKVFDKVIRKQRNEKSLFSNDTLFEKEKEELMRWENFTAALHNVHVQCISDKEIAELLLLLELDQLIEAEAPVTFGLSDGREETPSLQAASDVDTEDESLPPLDFRQFSGLCAITERILFLKLANINNNNNEGASVNASLTGSLEDIASETTAPSRAPLPASMRREAIESADFAGLKRKFRGVQVSESMRRLFKAMGTM